MNKALILYSFLFRCANIDFLNTKSDKKCKELTQSTRYFFISIPLSIFMTQKSEMKWKGSKTLFIDWSKSDSTPTGLRGASIRSIKTRAV